MNGKKILITGAAGFTGRHFIGAAKAAGHHCIALCRYPSERVSGVEKCIPCDLLDRDATFKAVEKAAPALVVHLAAISFVAHDHTAEIYAANLLGTLNLLDAISINAPDIEKVLLASSANIYGNASSLPITEETPPKPLNHYGVSKYSMEMSAGLYSRLPIVIVRPFNYTGAGQPDHFLIPKLVGAFKKGDKTINLGNTHVARDFSDVRDVVTAYLRLLEKGVPHKTYNVCSGRSATLSSVVEFLEELAGYQISIEQDPGLMRDNEILDLYGSSELLKEAIGEFRKYRLQDTLAWMMACSAPP
jgi:nucleoside-diphosphate-sugar epimerase